MIGALVLSGCKKDEEPDPVIEYPITLSYKSTINDSGIKAYEMQNGALVEISAAPYESNPDFEITEVEKIDRFVLLSETTGELTFDGVKVDATYTNTDGNFKFDFKDDPTDTEVLSHTANGSVTELNSPGLVVQIISSGGGGYTISGVCMAVDDQVWLPCGSGSSVTSTYSPDMVNGDILVYRTFDFQYK